MATGTMENARGYCPDCDKYTKIERNSMVWGCGDLIMIFITFGAWVLVRFVFRPEWRCSKCGAKSRKGEKKFKPRKEDPTRATLPEREIPAAFPPPGVAAFLDPVLVGRQVHVWVDGITKLTSPVAQVFPDPVRPGFLTVVTQSGSRYTGYISQNAAMAPLPAAPSGQPSVTRVLPTIQAKR